MPSASPACDGSLEPLLGLIDLVEIAASLCLGMLFGQYLIDGLGGEAVDHAGGRLAIVGEGVEHPSRTTVVGGDHRIAAGLGILDIRQIDGLQQVQVGGPHIDVVGRIEQICPGPAAMPLTRT